jgi:hypothetical protein
LRIEYVSHVETIYRSNYVISQGFLREDPNGNFEFRHFSSREILILEKFSFLRVLVSDLIIFFVLGEIFESF